MAAAANRDEAEVADVPFSVRFAKMSEKDRSRRVGGVMGCVCGGGVRFYLHECGTPEALGIRFSLAGVLAAPLCLYPPPLLPPPPLGGCLPAHG